MLGRLVRWWKAWPLLLHTVIGGMLYAGAIHYYSWCAAAAAATDRPLCCTTPASYGTNLHHQCMSQFNLGTTEYLLWIHHLCVPEH